jgi:hypothetical protein
VKLDLAVGDETTTLESVQIYLEDGPDIDELYGNLGQDILARFESLTLDFSRMNTRLGPRVVEVHRRWLLPHPDHNEYGTGFVRGTEQNAFRGFAHF